MTKGARRMTLALCIVLIFIGIGALSMYPKEAAPMPTPEGWSVATTTLGVTFAYPPSLSTKYIHPVMGDWPPKLAVQPGPFTCNEGGTTEAMPAGMTRQQVVNGTTYCVTRESEGAAGSIYTMYAYAFAKNNQVYILTFSLQAVQCVNYPEPQQSQCQAERDAFDISTVIDQMVRTIPTPSVDVQFLPR